MRKLIHLLLILCILSPLTSQGGAIEDLCNQLSKGECLPPWKTAGVVLFCPFLGYTMPTGISYKATNINIPSLATQTLPGIEFTYEVMIGPFCSSKRILLLGDSSCQQGGSMIVKFCGFILSNQDTLTNLSPTAPSSGNPSIVVPGPTNSPHIGSYKGPPPIYSNPLFPKQDPRINYNSNNSQNLPVYSFCAVRQPVLFLVPAFRAGHIRTINTANIFIGTANHGVVACVDIPYIYPPPLTSKKIPTPPITKLCPDLETINSLNSTNPNAASTIPSICSPQQPFSTFENPVARLYSVDGSSGKVQYADLSFSNTPISFNGEQYSIAAENLGTKNNPNISPSIFCVTSSNNTQLGCINRPSMPKPTVTPCRGSCPVPNTVGATFTKCTGTNSTAVTNASCNSTNPFPQMQVEVGNSQYVLCAYNSSQKCNNGQLTYGGNPETGGGASGTLPGVTLATTVKPAKDENVQLGVPGQCTWLTIDNMPKNDYNSLVPLSNKNQTSYKVNTDQQGNETVSATVRYYLKNMETTSKGEYIRGGTYLCLEGYNISELVLTPPVGTAPDQTTSPWPQDVTEYNYQAGETVPSGQIAGIASSLQAGLCIEIPQYTAPHSLCNRSDVTCTVSPCKEFGVAPYAGGGPN